MEEVKINELKQVLQALLKATNKIHDQEDQDGDSCCEYCNAEDYPVDGAGDRIFEQDVSNAVEWWIDHEEWCPSYIIDHAFHGMDEEMLQRVLAFVRS